MIGKCETCDNRDYNQYGFYCSVLYPKPEINGNDCSAYKGGKNMITTLYKVTTTFLDADSSSEFYFDTLEKAKAFLEKQDNGEIEQKQFESNEKLNYWDGCTWNELTYDWQIDVKEV